MSQITIQICLGTACVVMGGVDPQSFVEELPPQWRDNISIQAAPCLQLCKDQAHGKAPFVLINGEILSRANAENIRQHLQKLIGDTIGDAI